MQSRGESVRVGAVVADMIVLYRSNLGALIGASAAVFVIVGVLQAALYPVGGFLPVAVAGIAGLVGTTLYSGFVVRLVEDVRAGAGSSAGVGELFGSAAGAVGALIVNGIVKAILVVIGLLLLVLPGVYLLTIWALTAPVIVIERSGAIAAFNRSGELVRGRGWEVLAVVVVSWAIGLIVAAIFSALGAPFGSAGRFTLGTLGGIAAAPIWALVAAILYFQLAEIESRRGPGVAAAAD